MKPLKKYRAGSVSAAVWENEANVNGKKVTLLKANQQAVFTLSTTFGMRKAADTGARRLS